MKIEDIKTVIIVEDDKRVIVDGRVVEGVAMDDLDSDIWAMHFNFEANQGHVEYNSRKPNLAIVDVSDFSAVIVAAVDQINTEDAAQVTAQAASLVSFQSIENSHNRIDVAAGHARERYISPGTAIAEEYTLALQDAENFKAAGYTGDVPPSIQVDMNTASITAQAAADAIITMSQQYRALLEGIRAIRLTAKAQIATLITGEERETYANTVIDQLNAV
jgi:hypothetical protein